jgi:hypothetical protein
MKVKELIRILSGLPPKQQEEEVVYRGSDGDLKAIDYFVKETNGSRILLTEEWY